jgi:hypothetical protein
MCRQFVVLVAVLTLLAEYSIAQETKNRPLSTRRAALAASSVPIITTQDDPDAIYQGTDKRSQDRGEAEVVEERFSDEGAASNKSQESFPEDFDFLAQRRETLKDWPRISIEEIDIDPRDKAEKVPADRAESLIERYARDWSRFDAVPKDYCWVAPNLRYQPLYFEDVALERYRQRFINDYWQTAASGTHFFTSLLLLPLHLRQDPIYSCDYPLGWCRPGTCPDRIYQRQFWGWHR